MDVAIQALLVVLVLAAWLGTAGFAQLRSPLDKMHCVTFVNTTYGIALILASLLSDGPSVRAGKILLIVGVSLLTGAAFQALQAPDVAFSELTVGTAALPLLFPAVLASVRMDRRPGPPDKE